MGLLIFGYRMSGEGLRLNAEHPSRPFYHSASRERGSEKPYRRPFFFFLCSLPSAVCFLWCESDSP